MAVMAVRSVPACWASLVATFTVALLPAVTSSLKLTQAGEEHSTLKGAANTSAHTSDPDLQDALVRDHDYVSTVRRAEATERALTGQVTSSQCLAIWQILSSRFETRLAAELFRIACENAYGCEHTLPDLSSGLLYVSTDNHLKAMLAAIGRPHPCGFTRLLTNGLFNHPIYSALPPTSPRFLIAMDPVVTELSRGTGFQQDLQPSALNNTHTSAGGSTYLACPNGFLTVEKKCAQAQPLSESQGGIANIWSVDAVIGMPESWENNLYRYVRYLFLRENGLWTIPRDGGQYESTQKLPMQLFHPLKVKFFACPARKSEQEMRQLCRDQVEVLNLGYSGRLPCDSTHQVYDLRQAQGQSTDTLIRFKPYEEEDFNLIDHPDCSNCEETYHKIWQTHMPEEQGVVKVLLCDTQNILGVSAFPWDDQRGTMFDYRTLPHGGMLRYDEGKTMVHELGHYLGLYHTFENGCSMGGDSVDDTNDEEMPHFGCPDPRSPPITCDVAGVDPVHNFMDYADDRCMCSFTTGQGARLSALAKPLFIPDDAKIRYVASKLEESGAVLSDQALPRGRRLAER